MNSEKFRIKINSPTIKKYRKRIQKNKILIKLPKSRVKKNK